MKHAGAASAHAGRGTSGPGGALSPGQKGTIEMDVTTDTFERDVLERSHELPVVVDFWAAWCGPCRMLGPALEAEALKRTGQLALVKVDVEAEPGLATQYGVRSIPTVAVFRDGQPLTGFIGAYPGQLIGEFFDEQIIGAVTLGPTTEGGPR